MSDVIKKQVCKCEQCGNEAEMTVTCSIPEDLNQTPMQATSTASPPPDTQKVKGTATCSHCGSEADMWIDIEP